MQEDENDFLTNPATGKTNPATGKIRQVLKALPPNNRQRPGGEQRQQLSATEKEALWQRIQVNVRRVPRAKQRLIWLRMAAAIIFLAGVVAWLLINRKQATPLKQMMAAARVADTVETEDIQVMTAGPEKTAQASGQPAYRTVVVPYGKQTVLSLPDSSRVWLNSGSTLVYPGVFAGPERQVYLEGEGYFDVRHEETKPFFVQTRNMEIKVLGTEFNVSAYADDGHSNVVLVRGSIELSANRDKLTKKVKTRLVPHEMAVYRPSEKQLEVSDAKVEEYVSWRTGSMVFNATPLREILKKLQRYYRVSISLESAGLGAETFTGPLDLKKKIEEVMDIICLTTALVYEKQDGKIVLKEHE